MRIMLDAGHGGSDAGAVRGTVREADLNLAITLELGQCLKDHTVIYTREKQAQFLTIGERCAIEQAARVDCFVSIHCNAGPETAQGYEVFYAPGSEHGKDLAGKIMACLDTGGRISRGVKPDTESNPKRLGVLRETHSPAALVECGFISNEYERAWLCDPDNQRKVAGAIARGIKEWGNVPVD